MSELMNTGESRTRLLQRLLATASVLSLLTTVSQAQAEEADRPTVWVELGAQLERVDGGQQYFTPPFTDSFVSNGFTAAEQIQRSPRYSNGAEGKLSFAPEGSNWVFSASLRYGRSNAARVKHQETAPASAESILSVPLLSLYSKGVAPPVSRKFADSRTRTDESHAVMDFKVGHDVGLGLFGAFSNSQFDFGVRVAQFASKSTAEIGANTDFSFSYKYATVLPPPLPPFSGNFKIPAQSWHLYDSQFEISRSFRGIGPSVGWDASATVLGNPHDTALTFDWGVNASVLFGRQKVTGHHQTTARYRPTDQGTANTLVPVYHHSYPVARSRSVTIPNVGGFAGFSVKLPNAKVSLGYRADVFFGAIDGGIDARKTYDRAFYGPFATISFGMGG